MSLSIKRKLDDSIWVPNKQTLQTPSESLLNEVNSLFPQSWDPSVSLKEITAHCFEKISERAASSKYLTSEEINKIYHLLFETQLKQASLDHSFKPTALQRPHPAYVIKILHEALEALEAYSSFEQAEEARADYLAKWPAVKAFLTYPIPQRKVALPIIEEQIPEFGKLTKSLPLMRASDLLGGDHLYPAYALRNGQQQPLGIFKPTMTIDGEGTIKELSQSNCSHIKSRNEQLAHRLNFHGLFPIPATFSVEIKGQIGSFQLYVDHEQGLPMESTLETDRLALVIFDLLFANKDRTDRNVLVQKNGRTLHLYGIDHGDCITSDGRPLRIDTIDELGSAFFPNAMYEAVSTEAVERYAQILREFHVEELSIGWMRAAARVIENNMGNRSCKSIAGYLMKEYLLRS